MAFATVYWLMSACWMGVADLRSGTIGSLCISDDGLVYGRCALIHGCPSIVFDIIYKKKRPVRCGFHWNFEVVCCPAKEHVMPHIANAKTNRPPNDDLRISERMCMHYNYQLSLMNIDRIDLPSFLIRSLHVCPLHRPVPIIAFGTVTTPGEYPHMALIGFDLGEDYIDWGCGGSLISDQFILTAAHCNKKANYGYASYVRLDEYDLSRHNDAYPKDYKIAEFIQHPNYDCFANYDDIALIKLETKVDCNEYTRPACLPPGPDTGTWLYATGWGQTDFAGPRSNVMLEVALEIFNESECENTYRVSNVLPRGVTHFSQICAGDRHGHKDTCAGDSGGPLQRKHPVHHCLIIVEGITSYGVHCSAGGHPGIYTRVYAYIDWIENVVWG